MPDFLHADKENFSDEELMQEEQIRPQSFKDFAGQRKTLDNLEVFVAAAKNRGGALDHVLLHGPPGLGKTTLAHIIANGNNHEPRLYFNYNIELSRELTAQSYHDDFEFEIITPVGEQGITITI